MARGKFKQMARTLLQIAIDYKNTKLKNVGGMLRKMNIIVTNLCKAEDLEKFRQYLVKNNWKQHLRLKFAVFAVENRQEAMKLVSV